MVAFISEQSLRDYLDLEAGGSSQYTSGTLGSNIRAASYMLQASTGRQFEAQDNVTRKFTSEGGATVALPGLRDAGTITKAGSDLTVDESYWLLPDPMGTGLYTAIQFRGFGRGLDYRAYPQWFDRNYDSPYWARMGYSSFPNDVVFTNSDWGLAPADYPEPLLHATKVLAAWYTKRPDALLSGAIVTEAGAFDLSRYPVEVQSFIAEWRVGTYAVAVG
jgi:hypothetical protein